MEKYIVNKLLSIYPNSIITNFAKEQASMYQLVCKYSKENKLDVKEFLAKHGFNYILKKRGVNSKFDFKTANKLIEEYDVTQQELAKWFKVSRQAINRKVNKHIKDCSWVSEVLTNDEEKVIRDMIEKRLFTYIEEELVISIKTNYSNPCIVIINSEQVKVVFNINESIRELFLENKLDIFREIDFEYAKYLNPVLVLGEKKARIDTKEFRVKIGKYCEKINLSLDEYCVLHGFDNGYCKPNMTTDEELVEIIQEYVVKDNLVFFPHGTSIYDNFTNRASRANISLDELFESLGYIKIDSLLETSYHSKIKKYIEELNQNIIENSINEVIVQGKTKLYQRLYTFAKRRNISLNELLSELGFKRVYSQKSTFNHKITTDKDNFDYIDKNKFLEEIKQLQSHLEKSFNSTEKINRNQLLVSKLKKLYGYKCQLCDDIGIPLIEKEDGTYYVEVHHIVALSKMGTCLLPEGFDDEIDTYKNAIVVCPFHHKVLHYHQGGFEELIKENNEIYFLSKKETLLKLVTNYHLTVN